MTISAVDANSEKADDKLLRRFSYFARNWFSSIFAMCIIVEPSFWLIAQPTTHQIQQSDTDSTSDPTITNNNQGHHLDIRNEQWLKQTTITTSITINIITKNDIWLTAMGIIAYCCWYLERERAVILLQYQMCWISVHWNEFLHSFMCKQSHCTSCDRGQQADRFIPVQFRTITPRLRAFYFIIPPILLRQIQPQQTISSTASSSLLSTNTATNQPILLNALKIRQIIQFHHFLPSFPNLR